MRTVLRATPSEGDGAAHDSTECSPVHVCRSRYRLVMEWTVVASVIAALAGLIATIGQTAKLVGDGTWYRRWVEVLQNATNENQRLVARERIQHYIEEFAVTDRTRKRRRSALAIGAFLLVASLIVAGASATSFIGQIPVAGWGFAALGGAAYALGLYLIIWFPDQERARARKALDDELRAALPIAPPRWRERLAKRGERTTPDI